MNSEGNANSVADASSRRTAGVIAPPPILVLIALGVGIGLSYLAPLGWIAGMAEPVRWSIGAALLFGALLLEFAATRRFRRKNTPVQPWKPVNALVTDGVFAVVRNPMYVGFFLFQLGVAFLGAFDWVLLTTALWFPFQHVFVVRREERYLAELFGAPYLAYCRRVRRYGVI